jgi:hypothetical protein
VLGSYAFQVADRDVGALKNSRRPGKHVFSMAQGMARSAVQHDIAHEYNPHRAGPGILSLR